MTQLSTVNVSAQKPAAKATTAPAAKPAVQARSFPDTAKITVVAETNPKRPGTKAHAKWQLYAKAKTVGDVIAAFVAAKHPKRRALSALRWDEAHGFIKIEGFTKEPAAK